MVVPPDPCGLPVIPSGYGFPTQGGLSLGSAIAAVINDTTPILNNAATNAATSIVLFTAILLTQNREYLVLWPLHNNNLEIKSEEGRPQT